MTNDLTKIIFDLPHHWAVGGESVWAPEASIEEVRGSLDALELDDALGYETCEARVEGSSDDAASEEDEAG